MHGKQAPSFNSFDLCPRPLRSLCAPLSVRQAQFTQFLWKRLLCLYRMCNMLLDIHYKGTRSSNKALQELFRNFFSIFGLNVCHFSQGLVFICSILTSLSPWVENEWKNVLQYMSKCICWPSLPVGYLKCKRKASRHDLDYCKSI